MPLPDKVIRQNDREPADGHYSRRRSRDHVISSHSLRPAS